MQCVAKRTKSLNFSARRETELVVTQKKKIHYPRNNEIWHAIKRTMNQKLKP